MSHKLPILYTFIRCPWAMRARIALAYAHIVYETREVDLKNKPQELLEISPKATVPVLVLPDNNVLDESLDIVLWAMPNNVSAAMLELIKANDTDFKTNISHYKYPNKYLGDPNSTEYYRANAQAFVSQLEQRLATHDYLFGSQLSVADICIFPLVRQFANVDPDWFAKLSYPKVKHWLTQITNSAAFQTAMAKQPVWQA